MQIINIIIITIYKYYINLYILYFSTLTTNHSQWIGLKPLYLATCFALLPRTFIILYPSLKLNTINFKPWRLRCTTTVATASVSNV